jgi:hypothetical protein
MILALSKGAWDRAGKYVTDIIRDASMKFPYWHKKNKAKAMDNTRQYLLQTRHLLDK